MSDQQTIVVAQPEPQLLAQASDMLQIAKSYEVTCSEMRESASDDLKRVKALAKDLDEQRKRITRPLDEAKSRVMELFRAPLSYLEQAEAALKRACLTWDKEQDRLQRQREIEAQRKADEERKRLAAAAEKEKAAGNTETAHAINQAAQFVTPIPVQREQPKIAGEQHREVWRAELLDLVELARAVADGKASPENLLPNMPVLNSQARALKGSLAIPGVRAVSEQVLASRAA
jgi:hypothetical protein